MKTRDLVTYLDKLLDIGAFKDYCPNGLQVEGVEEVGKIVTGVTASLALIEAAVDAKADLLLVHHGFFWKSENLCITGMKARRIRRLVQSGLNLLAYHLPLDAHPIFGNNHQFGLKLGLNWLACHPGEPLVNLGEFPEALSVHALADKWVQCSGHPPLVISPPDDRPIKRVAWCTGAAQGYFEAATSLGIDAYISGEVSEQTFHIAQEMGVHYFAAGHHATERYGVQAIGEHISREFQLEHLYIDIPNPV